MLTKEIPSITVLEEIESYTSPLRGVELLQLEKNLLEQGCRDPLIVWDRGENQYVLVDGHHRYKICKKFNIPFEIKRLAFRDIEEIHFWMIENQMGRRNLSNIQARYYRGLKYLLLKSKKGGYAKSKVSTSSVLARCLGVSASTVKRDAKFAHILNLLGQRDALLKTEILNGQAKINISKIQQLISPSNSVRGVRLSKAQRVDVLKSQIFEVLDNVINDPSMEGIDELRLLVKELDDELFH